MNNEYRQLSLGVFLEYISPTFDYGKSLHSAL